MQSFDGLPGSFHQLGGVPIPAMLVFFAGSRHHCVVGLVEDTCKTGNCASSSRGAEPEMEGMARTQMKTPVTGPDAPRGYANAARSPVGALEPPAP